MGQFTNLMTSFAKTASDATPEATSGLTPIIIAAIIFVVIALAVFVTYFFVKRSKVKAARRIFEKAKTKFNPAVEWNEWEGFPGEITPEVEEESEVEEEEVVQETKKTQLDNAMDSLFRD